MRIQDNDMYEAITCIITNIESLRQMKLLLDLELPDADKQKRWEFVGQHLIFDDDIKAKWPNDYPTWIPVCLSVLQFSHDFRSPGKK